MEVSAKYEGQELEFQLWGELDHHGAKGLLQSLEREIERTLPMVLVLDLSGVTFMDSSGIGMIMGRYKNIRFAGGTVLAVRVNERIRRILTLSGVYKYIDIYEDLPKHSEVF